MPCWPISICLLIRGAIDHYHDVVEDQPKKILGRFAEFLGKGDGRNDARLIKELDGILEDALNLVYLDHSNHLFHQTNYHIHYFEMRKRQNDIPAGYGRKRQPLSVSGEESIILAQLLKRRPNS